MGIDRWDCMCKIHEVTLFVIFLWTAVKIHYLKTSIVASDNLNTVLSFYYKFD